MCETRTPASFWERAGKLDLSALQNSDKGNPVFGFVCYEGGEVEIFYRGTEKEKEVVQPIAVDEVCQRLPITSSSRSNFQAFSIPPGASIESAVLVAASTRPDGPVIMEVGPLPLPGPRGPRR